MTTTSISMPIAVESIVANPNQPRQSFDEQSIRELADSISENELLQPILVEDNLDGTFTLVSGERRLRAFKLLKRTSIPAIVREKSNHDGRELLIHAVIENVQRENMHPLDEAAAYQRLKAEFGMTWIEVGQKTGKNPAGINHLTILLKLDPEIQALIRAGRLTHISEVARALLSVPSSKARIRLAEKIADDGLTIKQAIALVTNYNTLHGSTRIQIGTAKSPAMCLAQRKSSRVFDEQTAPNGWDALKQTGKVPDWSAVAASVTASCKSCSLASMANEATCGECPLVDFLTRLSGGCHA